MGKTSSYQGKKKKTKVRKLINRAKNGLQRARKFCKQHVAPVMLATAILGGVIFGTYLRATATGVEELFYTYWDLVSSIFAAEGYDMTIKNGNDQISTPDRVTGRQLWNNIKTWVKLKCADAKDLYDEFMLLPKAVTAEGIKMSKDLYDILGDYCAELSGQSSVAGKFTVTSVEQYDRMINAICGSSDYAGSSLAYSNIAGAVISGNALLSVVKVTTGYVIICSYPDALFDDFDSEGHLHKVGDWHTWSGGGDIVDAVSKYIYTDMSAGYFDNPTWIIKNGTFCPDVISRVKDAVDLKNAPDQKVDDNIWNKEGNEQGVLPWWYYPDLLDRSMRDQTVDQEQLPDGDPDDGDDNKDKNGKSWKDIIPALIPWNPTIIGPTETQTDSSSEKDSEKDTTKPGGSGKPGSSENPGGTEKDTEKDTEENVTDSGQLPAVAEKAGNWKRLFPFCIPWDMMSLIKSMRADKKAPVFEFKYTFKAVNYTWKITVDMSDYWKYIKIFRWGMTIFFIIGLFFLTVKFTTFVYKMGG